MRGHCRLLLAIVSLLFVNRPALAQPSRDNAADGTIVLGGGYFEQEKSAALLKKIIDLAGGAGTSLVMIPTADSQLEPATGSGSSTSLVDYEKSAKAAFARLGVTHVTVLHTRDRRIADSDAFVAPLRSANCVWIPGGSPQLLFAVYPKTKVQAELQGVLHRGGVVAGDSAGALVIGQGWLSLNLEHPEIMLAPPQEGLALLPNALIFAHVNRYKPDVVPLGAKTYVSAHQGTAGILIEEHTAIMIQHGQVSRLVGTGRTGIVDGSIHGTDSVVWLSGTARYDLHKRELVP